MMRAHAYGRVSATMPGLPGGGPDGATMAPVMGPRRPAVTGPLRGGEELGATENSAVLE
jgi:hypothetical protein